MIIAVSGATGSIGKELVPYLETLNHLVLRVSSSIQSDGKKNFSYSDLTNNKITFQVDLFIHLATMNNSIDEGCIDREVKLASEILFSLPNIGCKKLIFFSTSKVYGDNSFLQNIFNENSQLNPSCSYGTAKKLCEEFICSNAPSLDIDAIIFRLPPVLNQSYGSNVGKLIKLSKTGMPILSIAQGDCNQRSFISFNNIQTVFMHLLKNIHLFKKVQIYNLSDDEFISSNQLVRISGKSNVYSFPRVVGKALLSIPILKNILAKLYGNFVIDNSKLKEEMSVKLETTAKSLPIIYR